MTESNDAETVREHRDLLEEVAELDLPISDHAKRILDKLDDKEE